MVSVRVRTFTRGSIRAILGTKPFITCRVQAISHRPVVRHGQAGQKLWRDPCRVDASAVWIADVAEEIERVHKQRYTAGTRQHIAVKVNRRSSGKRIAVSASHTANGSLRQISKDALTCRRREDSREHIRLFQVPLS